MPEFCPLAMSSPPMHISATGTMYNNGQPSNVDYDAMMGFILKRLRVQIKPQVPRPAHHSNLREDFA
jgi:hypothetical protein